MRAKPNHKATTYREKSLAYAENREGQAAIKQGNPSPIKHKVSRDVAYQRYIASKHWRMFKQQKAAACPKMCCFCSDTVRVELHHMIYRERFTDAKLDDTCWLCTRCHQTFHKFKCKDFPHNMPHREMVEGTCSVIMRALRVDLLPRSYDLECAK